jgi:hypothetical protein
MPVDDRDERFAELLSAVIERHAVAGRLQATATLAEHVLASAMRIGDEVRRALRGGGDTRPNDDDCRRLGELADALERATDAALDTPLARALRAACASGDALRGATLALELFSGVARPQDLPSSVYVAVAARRRARTGETLLHPVALADELAERSRSGLRPASGAEADDALLPEPIALARSLDASGAEIALCRTTTGLEDVLLEDSAAGDLLVFSRDLAGPFSVALASDADDEWWAASSFRWPDYRRELEAALRERGIDVAAA